MALAQWSKDIWNFVVAAEIITMVVAMMEVGTVGSGRVWPQ